MRDCVNVIEAKINLQIILLKRDFKHSAVCLSSDDSYCATEHRPNICTKKQTRSSEISRISCISKTNSMYRFIHIVTPVLSSEVACKAKLTSTPLFPHDVTLRHEFIFKNPLFTILLRPFPVFYPNLLSSQFYLSRILCPRA